MVLIGCTSATKETKKSEESKKSSEVSQPAQPAQPVQSAPTAETIQKEWTSLSELKDVNFDFDKAELGSGALSTLKGNAASLKKLPSGVQVIVEGYCDERGTIEYNVALGQRRADAVKTYYAHAGIPRSRLSTISYGKERPLCSDSTEECWARNRRGVTRVRSDQPVTVDLQ